MAIGPRLYLALGLLVALCGLGAVWAYTSTMRMAFMESGYPAVAFKNEVIATCDFGDMAAIGDSRAEAGIIPEDLPVTTVNVGIAGMTPVETYFVARALAACKRRPRFVLYSHSISAFTKVNDGLWLRAARFGLLHYQDLRSIESVAHRLHDSSVDDVSTGDGLTGTIRDLAYTSGFPSVFTSSLLEARGFGRYGHNSRLLEAVRLARGHVIYTGLNNGPMVGRDAKVAVFNPAPTEIYYFDKTVALLSAAGVKTLYLSIPVADATVRAMGQSAAAAFEQFIADHTSGVAGFYGRGIHIDAWPDHLFADGEHLNSDGAKIFSRRLARCVAGWTERDNLTDCDFHWDGP